MVAKKRKAVKQKPRSWIATHGVYPRAGPVVSGLIVGSDIANTGSIAASLMEYEVLGVREVLMADFPGATKPGGRVDDYTRRLAERIWASGRIDPLIVVIEQHALEGPYVLEGSHRFDALGYLGVPSFPALVVLDTEKPAPRAGPTT